MQIFNINGKIIEVNIGPIYTRYIFKVDPKSIISRMKSIENNLKLKLSAEDLSIICPIDKKSCFAIDIKNNDIRDCYSSDLISMTNMYDNDNNNQLFIPFGKDMLGNYKYCDILKHSLISIYGKSESGKTSFLNNIICSILMTKKPDSVKLMLIDTKKVELSNYNGVPHLLCPVVNDPKKANLALQKMVAEMERRYELFSDVNVKNIAGYNDYVEKENQKPHDMPLKKLSYVVIIIDELADLMLVASKEVEDSIMRITQMARAAGIHLIVATQRPSTGFITNFVKLNVTLRISFALISQSESKTILGVPEAEKLLGCGDMLVLTNDNIKPERIKACYYLNDEIDRIINYVCNEQKAQYNYEFADILFKNGFNVEGGMADGDDDPLYDEIVEFAVSTGKISASLIQRRFRLGYNRAARLVDLLEERGIIGPQNGSKPREVLVKLDNKNF